MPPYHQSTTSHYQYQYYSDNDDEDLADCTNNNNDNDDDDDDADIQVKVVIAVRMVRFAEGLNRVHVYPGVSAADHNRVWYTQEEEDAFLLLDEEEKEQQQQQQRYLTTKTTTTRKSTRATKSKSRLPLLLCHAPQCSSISATANDLLVTGCHSGIDVDLGDDDEDDTSGDEEAPQVLSTALLLGSLVVQGVVLRAVLLGHEIASHLE